MAPPLNQKVRQLTQTMTYRKSPRKAAAKREWDRFVSSNQPVITSTGLPDSIFTSIDHFDDFLSHGRLEHHLDPGNFRVEVLNSTQYDARDPHGELLRGGLRMVHAIRASCGRPRQSGKAVRRPLTLSHRRQSVLIPLGMAVQAASRSAIGG